MAFLDLGTAIKFDINILERHSWGFEMEWDEDGVPLELSGVWTMTIFDINEVVVKTMVSNIADSGLSITGNKVIVDLSVIKNDLYQGFYRYQMRKDENGYSTPIAYGVLITGETF